MVEENVEPMKMSPYHSSGLIAGGGGFSPRSEAYRTRVREVRQAVSAEYEPKLAAAPGWRVRLRLRWQRFLRLRRELRKLRPSPHICYGIATSLR